MNKTLIIDYSLGNLLSVSNAIEAVGGRPEIIDRPESLDGASHLILPGVGAFGDGIGRLRKSGWIDAISGYIQTGRPFLGICLGMQLLASSGKEHGEHQGMGVVDGVVDRMTPSDERLRVPHIGWNVVTMSESSRLCKGLAEKEDFYFVHSYVFVPRDVSTVAGVCDYGGEFAAILEHENVFATQFHPEKSQRAGLSLMKNFIEIQ